MTGARVSEPPRLSVVIPAYNARRFLTRCLAALGSSTHRDFECLVVDDGSTEPLRDLIVDPRARYLRLDRRGGPGRARNRAAAEARGDILVFLDADVQVHTDTLRRMLDHLAEHPTADAVIGSYDDTPEDPGFISQYKNLFHHYVHQHSRRDAWTFWAGCGAMRRPVFEQAGGFDESYTRPSIEDIELGFRLRAAGKRIDLDPLIQVTHLKRWTMRTLVQTDLFGRAIPWLLLMLRDRTMPADLNVKNTDRVSVALTCIVVAAAVVALAWQAKALIVALVGAAALLFLNRDLYRFFAEKRGIAFAVRGVALHWFYYLYCGVAVICALALHLAPKWARRHPADSGGGTPAGTPHS